MQAKKELHYTKFISKISISPRIADFSRRDVYSVSIILVLELYLSQSKILGT